MKNSLLRWLLLSVMSLSACLSVEADDDADRLRRAEIAPTREAIRAYLETLIEEADHRRTQLLISELGDARFRTRERATRMLAEMAFPPVAQLEEAIAGDDAERAMRARRILSRVRSDESSSILMPTMRVVANGKLQVGTALLLKVMERAESAAMRDAVLAAILATITDSDRPAAAELLVHDDLQLRNLGRRLLAHLADPSASPLLEGAFEAVLLSPGSVSGGGSNLIQGWEFRTRTELVVTELGIFDKGRSGLNDRHEVAIWDLENREAPVVQTTFQPGKGAELVGWFRYKGVAPAILKADRSYAVVAHYPSPTDSSVSLVNPAGLTLKFADHVTPGGRRYAFPREKMAFPNQGGTGHAEVGPTFRFQANPQP